MSSSDFDPGGYLVWVVGSLYLVLVDGPYGSIVHMVFHNHPCGFVGNLAFRMVPFVGSIGHDGPSVGNLVWAGSIGSIAHSMVRFVCLGNSSCYRIGFLGIAV